MLLCLQALDRSSPFKYSCKTISLILKVLINNGMLTQTLLLHSVQFSLLIVSLVQDSIEVIKIDVFHPLILLHTHTYETENLLFKLVSLTIHNLGKWHNYLLSIFFENPSLISLSIIYPSQSISSSCQSYLQNIISVCFLLLHCYCLVQDIFCAFLSY